MDEAINNLSFIVRNMLDNNCIFDIQFHYILLNDNNDNRGSSFKINVFTNLMSIKAIFQNNILLKKMIIRFIDLNKEQIEILLWVNTI